MTFSRKPWYQRAIETTTLWKTLSTPTNPNSTLLQTLKPTETHAPSNPNKQTKLRKCFSFKVATSFTTVCLCPPISSYTDVFNVEVPTRRSYTYPRSKQFPPPPSAPTNAEEIRVSSARLSMEMRRRSSVFRGKSLMNDVLMRRFVLEEEAMVQVRRRKNQTQIIRGRANMRRKKLGPSPLCRMVLA
ncbi:hypothetical protein Cgig2_024436 [Carnegiea gigantea]|uniref:Uncharacterized protein n=1 Tax=Carnegiea gigantea TaxID=171969 RepID=A0A9Q1QM75_9CARY|nr:hypothetical protein Cgig2_024436 [Carnegiea gigantea]